MPRAIAVIPAKALSSRVPNKNFREFHGGKSLLEIKIQQCIDSGVFDDVYVSSDSDEAQKLAERVGAKFIRREGRFCIDETPWNEVLIGVLQQIPVDNQTYIGWCPPTTPLFAKFDDAMSMIETDPEIDSVMTVTRLQHYFLNSDHLPLNFQYGVWASYSQKLKPIFQMNCALWLAKKGAMIQNRFQLGDCPGHLETSMIEGIDIDTHEEFEIASMLYERRQHGTADI